MNNLYSLMGITDHEALYYRVTYERLLEIIKNRKYKVVASKRSNNNYGEFRFVTLRHTGTVTMKDTGEVITQLGDITFWGHGYHECREDYPAQWEFYTSCTFERDVDQPALSKRAVIRELQEEHALYSHKQSVPGKAGEVFATLADLADDDAAYSELFQ